MMRSTIGSAPMLVGNWRRRMGSKTDAHLFADRRYPFCERRIPYGHTVAVKVGAPCADCLVAAISKGSTR